MSYYDEISESRDNWRATRKALCMRCGGRADFRGLQVHEIERRSHAPRSWAHPCNYLLLCGTCHEGEFATMPHARQLAYKMIRDNDHYDLEAWLALGRRPSSYVTQDEVDQEVTEILGR